MTHTTILLSLLACCLGGLGAADVAVLTDGDRLTGTVQKLENGKLFFQTKHSETPLQIDWTLVANLTTELDIKMKLNDGTERTGKLQASTGGMGFLASGALTSIQPAAVVSLAPETSEQAEETPGWLRKTWDNSSLSADFGQSYSGMGRYNQVSSNTEAYYKGDRWDGTLVTHFDYYGGTDSTDSTYQAYGRLVAERYIGGDHFFLFPYVFLGRQTVADGGRGQMRQYGGGAGWTFRRQRPDQVSIYAGMVRSSSSGFNMLTEELRADARFNDKLSIIAVSWERTLKHKIESSVRLYYFKPLNVGGHHSVATDASAKIPLFGPTYFTIHAYDTPELRQKQLFSTKNLQITSGIGIEF